MENWFDKLKYALLVTNIKGDLRQPHNYAMGRVPAGYLRWYVAQQYFHDIERILRELNASVSFVSVLPDEKFFSTHGMSREDYVMYHQGYFLDLTHQLKDKLCQMVKAVVTPEKTYSSIHERSFKLKKLLVDPYALRVPYLCDCLREWRQGHNGTIAIVLEKRKNYHHFKNPLIYAKDYTRTKTHTFLLSPSFQMQLSDYGKRIIAEKGMLSFKSWQDETAKKMKNTLRDVDLNLQKVARALVLYFKFTKDKKSTKSLLLRFATLDNLIEVKKNLYTEASIHPAFQSILQVLRETLCAALGDDLIALYVLGSVLRRDFIFGLSDINIVIVMKGKDKRLRTLVKNFVDGPPVALDIPMDTKILSENEFNMPISEKIRFICRTDGLLLFGKDLLRDQKDPKISFKLAWMLNKDFKDYIVAIKKKILDVLSPRLNNKQIAFLARSLAKRAYRLSFAQVIGNNTTYTASFKKMRELLNFFYPKNKAFNEHMYLLITRRIHIDQQGLLALIAICERNLLPLYEAINRAVNGSE